MRTPGIGAMIGYLGGNEATVDAYHKAIGKVISSVRIDDDANGGDGACLIKFSDASTLTIRDSGRSCCESRYMVCDDDLTSFEGAKLLSAELRSGDDVEDEYGESHETQFCVCETDKGSITLCTHNEHNGYYGGFWIELLFEAGDAQ